MYYDAHTHLNSDQLYPARQDHLAGFIQAWWKWLINIWVNHTWNQRAIDLAIKTKASHGDSFYMKAAIGMHPGEVSQGNITSDAAIQKEIEHLKRLHDTHAEHIVAIGECGIDAHYEWYDMWRWLQQALFHAQANLAKERNLPLVIHTRDQFPDTLEILKEFSDQKINLHCRGYTPEEIYTAHTHLARLRVWFCGNTTYKKAQQLRDSINAVASLAPLLKGENFTKWNRGILGDASHTHTIHFLLETDAPYLSPQQKRWTTNEPAHLPFLYEAIAIELDIPLTQLQEICKQNFFALYE